MTSNLTSYPTVHSESDLFYLHHFIAHTSIVYFPLQPEAALSFVVPTAQDNPYMLKAIVAASCGHHGRLTGSEQDRTTALTATITSLSTLGEIITTPTTKCQTTRSQSSAILCTILLLATSAICSGDTGAFRKHLYGALHIAQQNDIQRDFDQLWWLGLKWLVHLLLMNRLSGLPLEDKKGCGGNRGQSLASMLDFGEMDVTTGLSHDLVTILEDLCELFDSNRDIQNNEPHHEKAGESYFRREQTYEASEADARSLESRLLKLRGTSTLAAHNVQQPEVQCCHSMYINATLLYLYRRVDRLPKSHPKVQLAVEFIIDAVQKIDKYSPINIQLLWPLLTAGCEAITDTQRSIVVDRMIATSSRGLGSYSTMLRFMRNYWENGGDTRWDVFSRKIGMDLVLF